MKKKNNGFGVLGIDPGLQGHFVLFNGKKFASWKMPVKTNGKTKEIIFDHVAELIQKIFLDFGEFHVYLERAVSFGMGSTGAFNYGRGFAMLEIALKLSELPVTYVEPGKWTKEMHEGISKDLKPKAKSLVAVERLYPSLVAQIPRNKNGRLDEGCVDALLIAGYGYRKQSGAKVLSETIPDFY
jgi:hypothetical protein